MREGYGIQFVCLSISDFEDECGLGDDTSPLTMALFKNKIKGPIYAITLSKG